VLAQTYSLIEVIVSDNGSGDQTPEIVAKFADSRIRYRQNKKTIEAPLHWNQCLTEAKGEYFVIISDDDIVSPNFVESLVKHFQKNPSTTVGLTRCEIIDDLGQIVQFLSVPNWNCYNGVEFVLDWLWGRMVIPSRTFISLFANTKLLQFVGGYPNFTDGANSENSTIIALALHGDVGFVADAVFQYRVYAGSYGLSVKYRRLAQSAMEFREHLDADPELTRLLNNLPYKQARLIRRGVSHMLAVQYLGRLRSIYLNKLTAAELIHAIFSYHRDSEYMKALPYFLLSVIKKKLKNSIKGCKK
jgi:glycosyltransferase involved in cell wall biosynthesis